jgi:hypothetical protein
MNEKTNTKEQDEGRVIRDLHRRPRSRKHREIVLLSGERVKRTSIGWKGTDEEKDADKKDG